MYLYAKMNCKLLFVEIHGPCFFYCYVKVQTLAINYACPISKFGYFLQQERAMREMSRERGRGAAAPPMPPPPAPPVSMGLERGSRQSQVFKFLILCVTE